MSASTAIADVTNSLIKLLENGQDPTEGTFDVSAISPAEEINADGRPKVNLYLFRIEENPFAKNRDWQAVGSEVLHKTPLSLNLFYVLTPYGTNPLDPVPSLDDHKALGQAMRILYDNAIIEPLLLSGPLQFTAEPLKLDLCAFNLEDLTRVWNAFNKPYRLSVFYQVRIVFIDSAVERKIVRVAEKVNQHESM